MFQRKTLQTPRKSIRLQLNKPFVCPRLCSHRGLGNSQFRNYVIKCCSYTAILKYCTRHRYSNTQALAFASGTHIVLREASGSRRIFQIYFNLCVLFFQTATEFLRHPYLLSGVDLTNQYCYVSILAYGRRETRKFEKHCLRNYLR
jgi:hypothetical protein